MLTSSVFVFLALIEFCLVNILLDEFEVEIPGNAGVAAAPKNNQVWFDDIRINFELYFFILCLR